MKIIILTILKFKQFSKQISKKWPVKEKVEKELAKLVPNVMLENHKDNPLKESLNQQSEDLHVVEVSRESVLSSMMTLELY